MEKSCLLDTREIARQRDRQGVSNGGLRPSVRSNTCSFILIILLQGQTEHLRRRECLTQCKIDLGVTSGLFIYVFPQPGICSQLELLKVIGLPSYDTWKEWERSQLFHDPLFISQTMRKNANILLR